MNKAEMIQLALRHYRNAQLADAESICRQVLGENPNDAMALHLLGVIVKQSAGDSEESIALISRAIRLTPDDSEAHNNLGNVLKDVHRFDEAIASLFQAVRLNPNFAEAYGNLGVVFAETCRVDEAIAFYRRAIELKPTLASAHNNLGNALASKGQFDEAIASFKRAIALKPDYAWAYCDLGNLLMDEGWFDEGIAYYQRAVSLSPNDAVLHGNLLYAMHFQPRCSRAELLLAHLDWARTHAHRFKAWILARDRDPDRRLRIGYVSPDFRTHAVGRFFFPLLANHDHRRYEILCYSLNHAADGLTGRIRQQADIWRNVSALSDQKICEQIVEDRVDILVDLAMHTAKNRVLLFARKAAPIQVTYLAYPSTTGLETIDYRITDPYLDPPSSTDEFYTETSIRLPRTYWCYTPPLEDIPLTSLPADRASFVTFGCLNNSRKLTNDALEAWSQILLAVPDSHLLLHAPSGGCRRRVQECFGRSRISSERIEFFGRVPLQEYMNLYVGIDISLDPFPYVGGTTTCDSLWMGVPVVTLAGRTAIGRGGVSILSNVGLEEFIAESPQDYIRIAVTLANDRPRLAHLRSTIRERMKGAPLMDAKQFAADVENSYRQMWRRWCSGGAAIVGA